MVDGDCCRLKFLYGVGEGVGGGTRGAIVIVHVRCRVAAVSLRHAPNLRFSAGRMRETKIEKNGRQLSTK